MLVINALSIVIRCVFIERAKDKKKPIDFMIAPIETEIPLFRFFGTKGLQCIASPVRLSASGAGLGFKKFPSDLLQIISLNSYIIFSQSVVQTGF